MPITDADAVQEHTQLRSKAADKLFGFAEHAEKRLRELVSDDTYDEIKGDPEHDDYDALQRAESLLCFFYGVQFVNLRPTELGGFSKIIGYGDQQTEQLMSHRELLSYRSKIYGMALELIEDLLPDLDDEAESYDAGPFSVA